MQLKKHTHFDAVLGNLHRTAHTMVSRCQEFLRSVPVRCLVLVACWHMCLQVDSVNLAGLDRVLVVYAAGSSDRSILIRQYRIAFKKSGTKVRMLPFPASRQQSGSSTTYSSAWQCTCYRFYINYNERAWFGVALHCHCSDKGHGMRR